MPSTGEARASAPAAAAPPRRRTSCRRRRSRRRLRTAAGARAGSRSVTVLVAQLGAPAHHELLELGADRVVERRLLVALQRGSPELAGAGRGVLGAALGPAVEVVGRGQQRPV